MALKLYNTLSRNEQEVSVSQDGIVRIYSCGPTVYSRQHIGNYRAYINWDILHRALIYLGYDVKRIVNITDVGHLTSDDDWGEDKMEKGVRLSGLSADEIADHFIRLYIEDLSLLNVLSPSFEQFDPKMDLSLLKEYGWTRATEYIDTMIEFNKKIVENGFAYETDQALYFDVTKYPDYTKLSGQKLEDKIVGARADVNQDPQKRNPADFVIWMKRKGHFANHLLHWESPWGDGFPGWHLECSAMGWKELGENIDVHTGGIEHIGTHHTNEIAQNYGALGKDVVKMWVHNEHLKTEDGEKLAKSLGNALTIPELIEAGFDPMDFRYMIASVNYRVAGKFSIESLKAASSARKGLIAKLIQLKGIDSGEGKISGEYRQRFTSALEDNLNMSEAMAVLNELVHRSSLSAQDILATVVDFDRVFGLGLEGSIDVKIPQEVLALAERRKLAREASDFALSDTLRDQISKLGYTVSDTKEGQKIFRS